MGDGDGADDAGAAHDLALATLAAEVRAILADAEKTGALDEARLAELPDQIAAAVRAAWAEHGRG